MHAPSIQLTGNLAATPVLRRTANDVPVTSFRIANTPSRLDKTTGAWTDSPTTWFTVSCWRGTAENVARSLRQGDRVVVTGRLSTSTWTTSDGEQRSGLDIEATHVGLDLSRAPARVVSVPPLQAGTDPGERPAEGEVDPGLHGLVAEIEDLLEEDEEALASRAG
ncbi:MAG: single-strand binding protein [Frankiales bacterium]|nr:single-strand binding protein [Frankiales bacterium]